MAADLNPTTSNGIVEQQLGVHLDGLEKVFDADILSMVGEIIDGVDDLIRALVEERRQASDSRSRLTVLLTTNGGYIEVVQRIVDTFRHFYDYVCFVIPNYAFSAGTVLAMSGDEIYMDWYSRLGPIDPQVQNARGRLVPALGYLEQWERLLKKAESGNLTLAEVQLMIDGFDQAELYQYEQARDLSITFLKDWLVKYKFKNWTKTETREIDVTDEMKQARAEEIARELNNTERWHSHGSGISMKVLQDELKMHIDDLDSEPARCLQVKQYDSLLGDYMFNRAHRGAVGTKYRYAHYLHMNM